jgi:hypothetical protein
MRPRIARILAIAVCLIAPLGWMSHARADTTGNVSMTGEVVASPMSLTLDRNSFLFGTIDATGAAYDPATSTVAPYAVSGQTANGIPDGIAWFARQPLIITITSPVRVRLSACMTAQSNVLDGTKSRLNITYSTPASGGQAYEHLLGTSAPVCAPGIYTATAFDAGANQAHDVYPVYLVRATDTPNTFSMTVQFTISSL